MCAINLKTILLYLYAITCFFQAQFLTIGTGSFQLSIGRICFVIFLFIVLLNFFQIPQDTLYSYLGFWLVYQIINILNGIFWGITNWILLTYFVAVYWVLAIIISKTLFSLKQYKTLLVFFNFGIFVQVLIGLFEHYTGIYFFTSNKDLYARAIYFVNKKFPCAMQENPNDFAFLMLVGCFISLIIINQTKSNIFKVFGIITFFLEVLLIYFAESRGVLLGLLLGITYVILAIFKNNKHRLSIKTIMILLPFLAVFVINFGPFISDISSHLDFSDENSSRKAFIAMGLWGIVDTFGLGYGAFGLVPWHNHFIEIIADFGIIIFLLLLKFYYRMFRNLKSIALQNRELRYTCIFIRGFLLSLIFAFISPASVLRIEWFGAIIAIIVAFENQCLYAERLNFFQTTFHTDKKRIFNDNV